MVAGKQSKAGKVPECFGKAKVNPVQIAFIIDRYLCDNNFACTSSAFRTEASSLIAQIPVNQALKSCMTLGEMLEEYVSLKEQKVVLDQEKVMIEREKNRVQMLLQGVRNAMTAYNASGNIPPPAAKSAVAMVTQPVAGNKSHPGVPTPVQNRLNTLSQPPPSNSNVEGVSITTPTVNVANKKRKDSTSVDIPSGAKKSRGRPSNRKILTQDQNTMCQSDKAANNPMVAQPSAIRSSTENYTTRVSQVQGSNVAKCLFNQSSQPGPSNSRVPKTPPRANSSHSDANISPPETTSAATCNREAGTTRCAVISTKRVMLSPAKQMAYIEMRHCISPVKTNSAKASKRDHVKSRLDFDSAGVPESSNNQLAIDVFSSESEKEMDTFDFDFSNLDAFEEDFTEMLNELEHFPLGGIDYACLPAPSPLDSASGSPEECNDNHVTPELNGGVCEKDTRVIEKNHQQSPDQEYCK